LKSRKRQLSFKQKKLNFEQKVTTTRALQIELDMTAEQFRKLHEEKSRLLTQLGSDL
jgi:hypothetical protein